MNQNNNYLSKEATAFIKGIALVFMFIHHFFTLPEDVYVEQVRFLYSEGFAKLFCAPFKICVPIFAFITGYVYFFCKNKNLKYSIKKATDLWISYVAVLLVVLVPLVLLKLYSFSPMDFVLDLLALTRTIISFNWYIIFYILSIFLLPILSRAIEKKPLLTVLLSIILSFLICKILPGMIPEKLLVFRQIPDDMQWFPCVISGYVFARFNLFTTAKRTISSTNPFITFLIYLILMVIPFVSRNYIPEFDFITVPLFVFGISSFFEMIKYKNILKPINVIGKYSMYMWFFHCIFFNALKPYTQPILFYPQNFALVLCFGLIICIIPSIVVSKIINLIIRNKNLLLGYET